MKPGERSEQAESEQSERCQWSELGSESEGRSKKGCRVKRNGMVKFGNRIDFVSGASGAGKVNKPEGGGGKALACHLFGGVGRVSSLDSK